MDPKVLKTKISHTHSLILSHHLTHLTQDKDFSYSFSDSLSPPKRHLIDNCFQWQCACRDRVSRQVPRANGPLSADFLPEILNRYLALSDPRCRQWATIAIRCHCIAPSVHLRSLHCLRSALCTDGRMCFADWFGVLPAMALCVTEVDSEGRATIQYGNM